MEKKQSFTYQELASTIVKAVRERAATIPAFRDSHNGCIRITMVPLCKDADVWLGGMSNYQTWLNGEEQDVCEREFVYKIDPRGSHTIQYVCEDGHTEPINCYSYSALKTAWASKVRQWQNINRPIEPGPASGYYIEENGWSMHDGSVYTTVTLGGEDFCRLYVCTSGAKSSSARSPASWRLRNTSSDTSSPQNATLALIARSLPWSRSGAIESVQQKTQPSLGNWRGFFPL